MSGRKKSREVGGAAFVGVHEPGMPRVASVPGEEVAGRADFLPNAQGAFEMGSLGHFYRMSSHSYIILRGTFQDVLKNKLLEVGKAAS